VWGIVGAALQCSAMNVPWMCMSRLINGVGTGILNAVVPVWVYPLPAAEIVGKAVLMNIGH
jgi:hypothetical protein